MKKTVKKAAKKTAKKKTVKEPKKLPEVNFNEVAIGFAEERFRLGDSESYIAEQLLEGYKDLKSENIQFILNRASANIASEYARDRSTVVSLHVKRYNKDATKLLEKIENGEFDKLDTYKKRLKLIEVYDQVLEIIFAKEKVLQLHAKDTQIRVFNRLNAKIREKKVSYDLSQLSNPEKIELLSLLRRTKRTDDELQSVILRPKEDKQVTEDIEHEIVKERPNVRDIKKTNLPVLPPTPHPIDEMRRKKGLSSEEVMRKIQETLTERATEELKKKGAKI